MKYYILDKVGMMTSTICAIHCAILPLVIGVLPLIGMGFLAHGFFDWAMVAIASIVGYISLMNGHKTHKKHTAICFFIPGVFIILVSLFVVGHTDGCVSCAGHHEEFPIHSLLMAFGGILIAVSHFINMRLCKKCSTCSIDISKDENESK